MTRQVPLILIVLLASPALAARRYPCLPKGFSADTAVSWDYTGPAKRKITVGDTLAKMGARCRDGRLVDKAGREIKFYTVHAFGAPTDYALQTTRRERAEIEALSKDFTVITIPANQSGEPTP